jgi:hypothetical protein
MRAHKQGQGLTVASVDGESTGCAAPDLNHEQALQDETNSKRTPEEAEDFHWGPFE